LPRSLPASRIVTAGNHFLRDLAKPMLELEATPKWQMPPKQNVFAAIERAV